MDMHSLSQYSTMSGWIVGAIKSDLTLGISDMICLQTSSGIKGTADTFLATFLPGSRELQRYGNDHSNQLRDAIRKKKEKNLRHLSK